MDMSLWRCMGLMSPADLNNQTFETSELYFYNTKVKSNYIENNFIDIDNIS